MPVCGPVGKAKVKEALTRDLLSWGERQHCLQAGSGGRARRCDDRVGTEQSEFSETPTGSDGRRHLQDSNGSKTLDDDSLHWTSE